MQGIRYEFSHSYNGNDFERVIFSDSHDTAANGSVRLNEAADPTGGTTLHAREKALLADAVTLTSAGIPMILQGSEFLQDGSFNDWAALEWHKTEKYAGILLAHKHLLALRHNAYDTTRGLQGNSTALFHTNDDNCVIGYHRWDKGGAGDDVLVIVNFSDQHFDHYDINLPLSGHWHVRFNSSWHGYSKDFRGVHLSSVNTHKNGTATITLPPYGVYILSQE